VTNPRKETTTKREEMGKGGKRFSATWGKGSGFRNTLTEKRGEKLVDVSHRTVGEKKNACVRKKGYAANAFATEVVKGEELLDRVKKEEGKGSLLLGLGWGKGKRATRREGGEGSP